MDPKKIANNILEFMFDPTVIPVEKRLYFRPEENLQNQEYDKAKADAYSAFGDQRHNSNFYPTRKNEREASMERKSLIASLDVLSQNFDESDPIGKDLRTMAYAVAHMTEDEYGTRLAKGKAEMVECPTCGGKVLKATGYCLHCKKKIAATEEVCKECGKVGCDGACASKEASEEVVNDFWSKEASAAVQQALLSDIIAEDEIVAEETPAAEKAEKETPAAEKATPVAETPAAEKTTEKETPAAEKETPAAEKTEKETPAPVEAKVDTSILAFDGIEMEASMEDSPELTDSDRAQLDMLFK